MPRTSWAAKNRDKVVCEGKRSRYLETCCVRSNKRWPMEEALRLDRRASDFPLGSSRRMSSCTHVVLHAWIGMSPRKALSKTAGPLGSPPSAAMQNRCEVNLPGTRCLGGLTQLQHNCSVPCTLHRVGRSGNSNPMASHRFGRLVSVGTSFESSRRSATTALDGTR
ncbi:hypothetical protein B0T17DRAFT_600555 [Bombardia bombarda]|uniref:Uncharacterized protein n=1 Tax=Bombardia bombarda TaxID=252184 RepID=A0AA40C1W4_9PEZI|nr:hypothetical protein B0T17DRAFT_600555 [Bombardia bombarda]